MDPSPSRERLSRVAELLRVVEEEAPAVRSVRRSAGRGAGRHMLPAALRP